MKTIVHTIRLRRDVSPAEFEAWVREKDYATCPRLPSVLSFGVHRVADPERAGYHYFEVIRISSPEAFEADMKTPVFGSLVERFDRMAEIVAEIEGDLVEPGHRYTA